MANPTQFRAHVIFGNRPGPRLLITAGVHGDEYEPIAAVERLTRSILPVELAGTLTLVPVVNEGAFNRGTRCADDARDLARTFPGDPGGTPTQRVAFELDAMIRSATHYVDLHTGGVALTLVPLSGYMLHPDARVLNVQREMAKAFDLPYIWGTTATLQGRTLSSARDANVPAIYVEHGGGAVFNPLAAEQIVRGCINVVRYLQMLSGPTELSCSPVVVEDNRPASGHLQVQNTAPIAGLFEASVRLGDKVSAHDALGTIRSPLTGEHVTVLAANGGVVFMLRLVASVHAGDALAAIVDTRGHR